MDFRKLAEEQKPSFLKDLNTIISINSVRDEATAGPGKPFGNGRSTLPWWGLCHPVRRGQTGSRHSLSVQAVVWSIPHPGARCPGGQECPGYPDFMGCDEESGMECMNYYLSHAEIPKTGFVPDADFPVIYGEKGGAHIILESETCFIGIPDIQENAGLSVFNIHNARVLRQHTGE